MVLIGVCTYSAIKANFLLYYACTKFSGNNNLPFFPAKLGFNIMTTFSRMSSANLLKLVLATGTVFKLAEILQQ